MQDSKNATTTAGPNREDSSWSSWYNWLLGQTSSSNSVNSSNDLSAQSTSSRPRAASDSDWTLVPARNRNYEQMLADEAYAKELQEKLERERRDEELARKLYEEEQQQAKPVSATSPIHEEDEYPGSDRALTDEEIARRLQEEEERQAERARARNALRSSAPPQSEIVFSSSSSSSSSGGRPSTRIVIRPAPAASSAAAELAHQDRMERLMLLMQMLRAANNPEPADVLVDSPSRSISSLLRQHSHDPFPQRPIMMGGGGRERAEVDLSNYEALSALPAVPRRGVAAERLSQLPTRVFSPSSNGGSGNNSPQEHSPLSSSCPICLTAYSSGETLRTLPCLHSFHRDCIDTWLKDHTQCPICKHPVS